ncbi:hypothetical protein [Mycolicibacterium thermoresistibile]
MRIAVLVAVSALVAACSQGQTDQAEQRLPTLSAPPTTTTDTPTTTTSTPPTVPPRAGAPIAEVVTWIEAGDPVDADGYRSATRDGETTGLDGDIAFVTPSGTSNCMTASRFDGALACLVELADPPPRPTPGEGQWQGGWVDFPGATLQIGSAHADPGRFAAGTGAELPYGQSLAFGDYRCRADAGGLFCVNYAHRSAVKFSETGVETFGCLQEVTPPQDVGAKFSC